MPAITLGLAEVEERLRALRRRLNASTAQHSLFVTLSTVIGVLTGLIVLGLRGTGFTFRVATWSGGALSFAAVTWGVLTARRRWLDVAATAQLADRRAALTDRLTTLVDLRARPRPSRLAPVLVAQVLALSAQWQPQRIAPRRIPRSVFALIVSLLALGATAFIERRPPDTAVAQAGAGTSASQTTGGLSKTAVGDPGATTADGPSMPGVPPPGDSPQGPVANGQEASGIPPRDEPQTGAPPHGAAGSGEQSKNHDGVPHAKGSEGNPDGSEQPRNALAALPDRLQDAIRRAFHAEPMDRPQQLAARPDPGKPNPSARGDDAKGNQNSDPRGATGSDKTGKTAQPPQKGTDAAAPKEPGKSKRGEQSGQSKDGSAANPNFDGNSPAAGKGSSPGALMAGKGQKVSVGTDGEKTFKLTITSFLRAMEQKGNQPRQSNKTASANGSANAASSPQIALNERQLNDDALRKAEIPPEYEDIVRRVYSLKADQ